MKNTTIEADLKKVMARVKSVHSEIKGLLKQTKWVDEARKNAKSQGREVMEMFAGDIDRVRGFLERERRELERFHKQLPEEVEKFRKFVRGQNAKRGKKTKR